MLSPAHIARLEKAAKPVPAFIRFAGGLDTETPPLMEPSGFLRRAQNVECNVLGGYARVSGYERFDGRTAPSTATAVVLDIALSGSISVGNTVTGATSTASAVVIAIPDATHLVLTKVSGGSFQSGENLTVGGLTQATTTSTAHGASTALLRAQYKNLAADNYRADIAKPTGSGAILGVVRFQGATYAFRNNAGGTAAGIWKSSASGWQAVTLYNEVSFTAGGTAQPAEGATLTQGGVTATVKRVVPTTAATTWGTSSAAGRLIITNPSGGNFAAGAATFSGGASCTLSGAQTAIALQPSGRYEFVIENFGGSVATNRIYGADGANRGFEFDGSVYVPISTGMTSDMPLHVFAHLKQLFFSFGASVQHAAPGTPYIWNPILGAAELGMGDTVTGFQSQPGTSSSGTGSATGCLLIFTRNRISVLYGTGVADWVLVPYRAEMGAWPYSIQDVGYGIFLDDPGITNFRTAQEYGNFAHDMLSARLKDLVNSKRGKCTASCVCRDKSQYRLFFSDAFVLLTTFVGKKIVGITPAKLSIDANCAWSSEESDGTETIFFGGSDGMVYQMERGTSFDGDPISYYMNLAWDFLKSPRLLKHFVEAMLEIQGTGYAEFTFGYKVGYGSTQLAQPVTQDAVTSFSPAIWDSGITWDNFVFDGGSLTPTVLTMGAEGENVSLAISGSSDYHAALSFSGAMVHYQKRRYLRG